MATQLFTNNATGYLSASILLSDTSISLQTGNGALFPNPTGGDWFILTLQDSLGNIEVCKCTARSTDVLTITRAQEDTAAQNFTSGSTVALRSTKGTYANFVQKTGDSIEDITIVDYTEQIKTQTMGSTYTVNTTEGTIQVLTTAGNVTITLPTSVAGKSYTLLVNYGNNGDTITWAGGSTIKWNTSGTIQTKIAGKIDLFTFMCDGTNTYGSKLAGYF